MNRRSFGILIISVLLTAGLIYGFLARPIPVDISVAMKAPMAVTLEEEGTTRVMDRYVITAPMTGYAQRIKLEVGDQIQQNQVLAILEPTRSDALDPRARAQARAQVSAAQAALSVTEDNARAAAADALLAQQELQRTEKLGQAKFLSQSVVDNARNSLGRTQAAQQAAKHQVNVARFELETARATLIRSEALQAGKAAEIMHVRAPSAARVLKVQHESEGAVQAGQPLLEIGNPEALEVEVELLSTAAVKIVPKSRVILDRWGGEHPLEGTVRVVEPAGFTKVSALGVEEQRVHVIVDIISPRKLWERLGDGYRVEAKFVVWEGSDVLQIPSSALFRYKHGWATFVFKNGRARLQPVTIGQHTGLEAEVLSGISKGDEVITHPDDKIEDHVRVQQRNVKS